MKPRRINAFPLAVGMALAVTTAPAVTAPLSSRKSVKTSGGTVERIKIHGRALEGNLEGESPDRDVTIYLPPSYRTDRNRRYPVVYLLHGYTGTDEVTWTKGRDSRPPTANVPAIADKVFLAGAAHDMILVMPNAYSIYLGSMYSNSVTAGNWEDYVADDLVAYMDSHYRTIADRMSRGLAGHSMGGYGTIRIGMKRPDVFGSIYALSACCLSANISPRLEAMAAAEAIKTKEDVAKAERGPLGTFARAAAWSPNPANPPLYLDLPVKDGKVRPEIVAKWAANAPLAMLDQYIPGLKKLHAIAFDIGNQDEAVQPRTIRELDEILTRSGVTHTYETYEGTHSSRIPERLETKVLPFFSSNLSAAATRSTKH
jgi:S-formylglutathione hydrolase FrmB